MCESTVRIENILPNFKNVFSNSKERVELFVRVSLVQDFLELLGGKGDKKGYIEGDVSYRLSKFLAVYVVVMYGAYQDALYRLESSKERVTAMKFMDKGFNDRLYCRELQCRDGNGEYRKVIISLIHRKKKTDSMSYKEKNAIEKVISYELDCEH